VNELKSRDPKMRALTSKASAHIGRLLLAGVLGVHVCMLALIAVWSSGHLAEASHLAAGLSHLYLGRFDLYRVDPPLPRTLGAWSVGRSRTTPPITGNREPIAD
jgi:hypothetical protein